MSNKNPTESSLFLTAVPAKSKSYLDWAATKHPFPDCGEGHGAVGKITCILGQLAFL